MVCKNCVVDNGIPGVVFDSDGVCNYCHLHTEMDNRFPMSTVCLMKLVKEIKEVGKNQVYDAVIGISGGCDSSYLLEYMCNLGLDVLAVHVDNGWNTNIARNNMGKMVKQLHIPFKTVKLDTKVFDSLCRSFLYASTPDADIVNDLALLEGISQVALDNDIRYVLNGHSFRTEGSAPLGWTYMDGGYLEDVNHKFEDIDLDGFPHLCWDKQLEFWDSGICTVRPMYHITYNKKQVIQNLINNFGWEWYQGLHAENIYTKFVGNFLWVKKFGIDYRKIEFSALVRSGLKDRGDALVELDVDKVFEDEYLVMILERLGLSQVDLDRIMGLPVRSYKEFDSYLPRFRSKEYRSMFNRLLREGKIPYTFYKKYILGV